MSRQVQVWNLPISSRNLSSKLPLKIGKFPCQKEAELFRLRVPSWLSGANVLLNFGGFCIRHVIYVISLVISATCSYGSWRYQLVPCEKIWPQFASVFGFNLFIQSEANPRWCWKATSHVFQVRYEKLAMTHFYTLPNLNFDLIYLFKKVAGFSPCQVIREKNVPPKGGFDMIGWGMRGLTVYPNGIDGWCSRMGFLGFITHKYPLFFGLI